MSTSPATPSTRRPVLTAIRALIVASIGLAALGLLPVPRVAAAEAMTTETRHVSLRATASEQQPIVRDATAIQPAGERDAAGAQRAAVGPRMGLMEEVEPFELIGLGVAQIPSGDLLVRVRSGGAWGPWHILDVEVDHRPEPGRETTLPGHRTEPFWVGGADAYEIDAPSDVTGLDVHLVRPGQRSLQLSTSTAGAALAGPTIHDRASWGARPAKESPDYAADFRMAIVHHSVTSNSYTRADVPSILRSIQAYHMDSNGWNDIAYNFAVDRYGEVWEARGGGVDRSVIGGHAYGFNTFNTGIVVLGDFTSSSPPAVAVDALGELIAWKFAVQGVNPAGTVPYTTAGSPRFAAGTYTLPRIVGHGDVGRTGCPGALLAPMLDEVRAHVAARYPAYQAGRGAEGLVGDFNGDGRADHLYYQPGSTPERLRLGRTEGGFETGALDITGTYRPVAGDFDGDGTDDVYLHGPGSYPDHVFYGQSDGFRRVSRPIRGSYRPFAGDFDGDGIDDVFWYGPGTGTDAVSYGLSGGGFETHSVTMGTTFTPVVGDYDGDGNDDVFWYRAGPTEDQIWYGSPTRGTFAKPTVANVSGTYQPFAGDRDGDGKDDLVLYGPGDDPDNLWTATTKRGVFSGKGFNMSRPAIGVSGNFDGTPTQDMIWYVPGPEPDPFWRYLVGGGVLKQTEWASGTSYSMYAGDFTGDGVDDLLLYTPGVSAYEWVFNKDGSRVQVKVA